MTVLSQLPSGRRPPHLRQQDPASSPMRCFSRFTGNELAFYHGVFSAHAAIHREVPVWSRICTAPRRFILDDLLAGLCCSLGHSGTYLEELGEPLFLAPPRRYKIGSACAPCAEPFPALLFGRALDEAAAEAEAGVLQNRILLMPRCA